MGTNGRRRFPPVSHRAYAFEATIRFYKEGLGFVERYGWGEGGKQAVLPDTGDGSYLEVFAGGTEEPKPETLTSMSRSAQMT